MLKKVIAICMVMLSLFALVGCVSNTYNNPSVSGGPSASDAVTSNGGFVVQKGDYIYYINSSETTSASNVFGEVTNGSLVRANLDGTNPVTVVSKLVANGVVNKGLFIFGDNIYFTSPSDSTNKLGEIQNTYMDVLTCKINGDNLRKVVSLKTNSSPFNFYEVDGSVYFVFTSGGMLQSVNTSDDKAKTIVIKEKYSAVVFGTSGIYYTSNIYLDKDNTIADRFNQVSVISADGKTDNVLFDGNTSGNSKYTVTLHSEINGKLYYAKSDTALTGSNALYSRSVNGLNSLNDEVKHTSMEIAKDTYLPYSYNGKNGIIASVSGVGTAFIPNPSYDANHNLVNKDEFELFTSSTLTLVKVVDGVLYYTKSNSTDKLDMFKLDIGKALANVESKEEKLTSDENLIYSKQFSTPIFLGNSIYFYRADDSTRFLHKLDIATNTITKVSK